MSLQDLKICPEYRTPLNDIVHEFYLPLLGEAVLYQRSVGFFSSSALVEISKGIATLAQRGGKIQIVASPILSPDDIEAIKAGYDARKKIEEVLLRNLTDVPTNYYAVERLNLLAYLIANGILDFKIACTTGNNTLGIYHEKLGLITDSEGNSVAFAGSMNETVNAMVNNYETIDVFTSWEDTKRVQHKQNAFQQIWNNESPGLQVMQFPHVSEAIIQKYQRKAPNFAIDNEEFAKQELNTTSRNLQLEPLQEQLVQEQPLLGARIPKQIALYDYQHEAITAWVQENYRGIFAMATGTGKTYTGLGAIATLSIALADNLAVIIIAPYQHLVEQWVADMPTFHMQPIIGYSSSAQKNWKNLLQKAVRDQHFCTGKQFFCFICTNATFSSEFVQQQINKIKNPILLVVDEAHNIGAQSYLSLLDNRFTYRLALSATLDRYRDTTGTDFLYQFFGNKCIDYSLQQAIKEDKLTSYKYYPIVVSLTHTERNKYDELSLEIAKCLISEPDGTKKLTPKGEMLVLKRARITAGATEKLTALEKVIKPYQHAHHILVYCGTTSIDVLTEEEETNELQQSEIRQIEAVTDLLGNRLNMQVSRFTSAEDIQQRANIKEAFEKGELQAIVAIKCLDEGVNIPSIRTAFILASTTNPKEYIQRRGRILRKAPQKSFAELFDFVTLPRPLDEVSALTVEQAKRDHTLVKNEMARIKEFGRLAQNAMDAEDLLYMIKSAYHLEDIE